MTHTRSAVCGLLAGLVLATTATAHHSASAFDSTKEVVMKATVVAWRWTSPHCMLLFDVTDETGKVTHWTAETSNPTDMGRRGWTRTSVKAGEVLTVSVQPARNGAPIGRVLNVTLADGQTLRAYGAQPGAGRGQAPAPATPQQP
jgi:hypothetical protein